MATFLTGFINNDPVAWINLISLLLAALSLPLVLKIRAGCHDKRWLPACAFLPWIGMLSLAAVLAAFAPIAVFGIDLHHLAEAAVVSLCALFCFAVVKAGRLR